jgi:hypothetical protein
MEKRLYLFEGERSFLQRILAGFHWTDQSLMAIAHKSQGRLGI